MFGSMVLEVALGLILIYLLLSLVCAAVGELIATAFKLRARDLERGVRALLQDPEVLRRFHTHPMIKTLQVRGTMPSYIPSRSFALALMDIAAPVGANNPNRLQDIRQTVMSLPEDGPAGDIKRAFLIMIDEAKGNIDHVRDNVETWFNSSMDRVSGSYKRRMQWIVLGLAFIVTVALNVDTVMIANRLSRDAALRSSLIAQAQVLAQQPRADNTTSPEVRLRETIATVQGLGLPIGWASDARPSFERISAHLLGWVITAFAVSLGAPFWFDTLNKFIVIRSTIKPHEKSREQPSKDRFAPDVKSRTEDETGSLESQSKD
ncbi:MAG: hypothetical protein H0T92_17225 [Pyrinomonadaceae bacterium]|nr:hypothetical protein [Pyrinomonadaceae bacterium]